MEHASKKDFMDHKTIENGFTWVPMNERKSRFGGPVSPWPAEMRRPLLWLARDGDELYLVNASGETLDDVVATGQGFAGLDAEVIEMSGTEAYDYRNVKPNDAVKIDEYDEFFDPDFILNVCVEVRSARLGTLALVSPWEKGGVSETVLLWDSGEPAKGVTIKPAERLAAGRREGG
jgi:hypothetical protein